MKRRIERLAARAEALPCGECDGRGHAPTARPSGAFDRSRLTDDERTEFAAAAARVCRVCRCGRVRVEVPAGDAPRLSQLVRKACGLQPRRTSP